MSLHYAFVVCQPVSQPVSQSASQLVYPSAHPSECLAAFNYFDVQFI